MKELFGDHHRFPDLSQFKMENTELSRDDLVKSNKLPELEELPLEENSLSCMEDEVENLIQACLVQ